MISDNPNLMQKWSLRFISRKAKNPISFSSIEGAEG